MDCADRAIAKTVLENRLASYTHMLEVAVDYTNGYLGLVHASHCPAMTTNQR